MEHEAPSLERRRREYFRICRDYTFCRTLAFHVEEGLTSHEEALALAAGKARAWEENRERIEASLARRAVRIRGQWVYIKDLSLSQIMRQEDAVLGEILEFYFQYPYAHGRTGRCRLLPRWWRTLFLRALIGHARRRGLELDYPAFFEMVTLL